MEFTVGNNNQKITVKGDHENATSLRGITIMITIIIIFTAGDNTKHGTSSKSQIKISESQRRFVKSLTMWTITLVGSFDIS